MSYFKALLLKTLENVVTPIPAENTLTLTDC